MNELKLNEKDSINLPALIDTRLLIQANSGGGKSWLIRRILEQSHGHVQQIILDLEGEFSTLREKYDYILAATDGDVSVDLKSASLFAKKLLELNVSAIIDLYDLSHQDRKEYVRRFLTGMMNAPKKLRHPVLVIIDEAHVFCPEKGQSVSSEAVIDLMTRGRKRGYCGVLATQRLSKLHKDAAAEANNKLIGRTGLDIDMKRAAEELGFTGKEQYLSLRNLESGEFFAYGPAISKEVIKLTVGNVNTTHPKAGSRIVAGTTVPPTEKIKNLLNQLKDLPQAVQQEEETLESLKREAFNLKQELLKIKRAGVPVPQEAIQQAVNLVKREMEASRDKEREEWQKQIENFFGILEQIGQITKEALQNKNTVYKNPTLERVSLGYSAKIKEQEADAVVLPVQRQIPTSYPTQDGLRAGAVRILTVLASRYPMKFTKAQLATLSKFKVTGGSYNTYLSALRTRGFISQDGSFINITEEGLQEVGTVPPAPQTTEENIKMWMDNLKPGAQKLFQAILDHSGLTREELAEYIGMTYTGGSFNTYLSMLRSNGLIEMDGSLIKPSPTLFL